MHNALENIFELRQPLPTTTIELLLQQIWSLYSGELFFTLHTDIKSRVVYNTKEEYFEAYLNYV